MNRIIIKNLNTTNFNGNGTSNSNRIIRRWKSLLANRRQQINSVGSQFEVVRPFTSSSVVPSIVSPLNTSLLTAGKTTITNNNNLNLNYQTKRNMASLLKNARMNNINQNFVTMEYAVRGPLVIRAGEIEEEIAAGVKKPFDEVIRANIGDCHAMGQEPITFLRQVLALCVHPELMESVDYPEDAKQRARTILNGCSGGSIGSYTNSTGITPIRQQVANYIRERDGFESDFNDIVLTAGATTGIKSIISMLNCKVDGKKPGIMVPIPQYPLYSATIAEYGMSLVGYYLDEANNWALDVNELRRALSKARKDLAVRAIVIINPGNPTGQVLTSENIMDIIRFAHEEKIIILADEVYQHNIYDKHSKFHSFKKTMTEMGQPFSQMEIASFMSTSKGFLGECGIRGGYMELCNFDAKVKAVLLKSITAALCPTTAGQVAVSVLVNPPKPSEQSYNVYTKEKSAVLDSLKARAELVYKSFNSFEGFSCNKVQGAMYAFPQIKMPQKAIDAAFKAKMEPDEFYAFDLLESTGICIVPGCGFGQKQGSYHFRTTILPQMKKLKTMLSKFHKFHTAFLEKYK